MKIAQHLRNLPHGGVITSSHPLVTELHHGMQSRPQSEKLWAELVVEMLGRLGSVLCSNLVSAHQEEIVI